MARFLTNLAEKLIDLAGIVAAIRQCQQRERMDLHHGAQLAQFVQGGLFKSRSRALI